MEKGDKKGDKDFWTTISYAMHSDYWALLDCATANQYTINLLSQ